MRLLRISAVIVFLLAHVAKAEIIDNTPEGVSDKFITIARRISYEGTIHASSFEGKPILEARFLSKLPPKAVINIYNKYFQLNKVETGIERFSMKEPVWKWVGEIDREEKDITIMYLPDEHVTFIEVKSFEDRKLGNKPPIDDYPFLKKMENVLISSREVFNGPNSSSIYIFQYAGSPKNAVNRMRSGFLNSGWRDMTFRLRQDEAESDIHFMQRGGEKVGIVAVPDEESLILSIIFSNTSLGS